MATHFFNRSQLLALALFSGLLVTALPAQPPQTRPQPGGQPAPQAGNWPQTRQPSGNAPSASPQGGGAATAQRESYHEPPTEYRINPGVTPPSQNWFLGVYPERAPRGVRVERVIQNAPAHRFGLESGDYILDVGGYVVGDYQGTYYPLPMAMDYGVGPNGWAELLVWNKRTYAEEIVWIQLQRR